MKGYFLSNDGAHYYFTHKPYTYNSLLDNSEDKWGETVLFHSKKGTWVEEVKGTKAVKMVNDGNRFIINFENKTFTLKYSEAVELELLLKTERMACKVGGKLPKKVVTEK